MIDIGDVLVCSIEKDKDVGINLKCSVIKEKNIINRDKEEYGKYEGIVVNEELAKKSPCYKVDGTNLVFSKGIVGALSDEQKD